MLNIPVTLALGKTFGPTNKSNKKAPAYTGAFSYLAGRIATPDGNRWQRSELERRACIVTTTIWIIGVSSSFRTRDARRAVLVDERWLLVEYVIDANEEFQISGSLFPGSPAQLRVMIPVFTNAVGGVTKIGINIGTKRILDAAG